MRSKSPYWVADQVKWPAGYPRQREYPHPPPPSTNNSTTMINRVVISHLFSTSGQCSLVTKAECARTHGRNPKAPASCYVQVLPVRSATGQPTYLCNPRFD